MLSSFGEVKTVVETLAASASVTSAATNASTVFGGGNLEQWHALVEIVITPLLALLMDVATIGLLWIAISQLGSTRDTIKSTLESSQEVMAHSGHVNQVLKSIDVSIHCANRYDSLNDMRADIVRLQKQIRSRQDESPAFKQTGDNPSTPTRPDALAREIELLKAEALSSTRDYYGRFWALKSDQFDFWLAGVLDHDSFFDWSFYLVVKIIRESRAAKNDGISIDQLPIPLIQSWDQWSSAQKHGSEDGRAGSSVEINHGGSNPGFVAFTNVLFAVAYMLVKVQGGKIDPNLLPQGVEEASTTDLWPKEVMHVRDIGSRSHNFTIALAVLEIINKLEQTGAAKYRKLLWDGKLDFEMFYKMMKDNLNVNRPLA